MRSVLQKNQKQKGGQIINHTLGRVNTKWNREIKVKALLIGRVERET